MDPPGVPFVVVGTKADHEEGRQVAHTTVAEFCNDFAEGTDCARFFEVSAKVPGEGAPVGMVFEHLVRRCVDAALAKEQIEESIEVLGGVRQPGEVSTMAQAAATHAAAVARNERGCLGGSGDCRVM